MEERPLTIGAVATHPDSVLVWDALRAHFLSVGAPMEYALYSTAERLSDQLLGGAVDVAWLPALTYARARAKAGVVVMPLLIGDAHRGLRTHLVTRPDGAIPTGGRFSLATLRGRTVAVGAIDDAANRVLPVFHLAAGRGAPEGVHLLPHEVDVGKAGETGAGARAVLDAVKEGRAEAGFVGERDWRAAGGDTSGLTIAWSTPPCDGSVFCGLASGPTGLRRDFDRAMRSFTEPAGAAVLGRCGVTAWVPARDDGHQALRTAITELPRW